MQTYTSPAERAYFAPDAEWSKAAQAAFAILKILKAAKEDVSWCSTHRKTSQNVADRWAGLQMWTGKMNAEATKYSPGVMKKLEKQLETDLNYLDEANVDFDADDLTGSPFEDELDQYAGTIIEALKEEMDCDAFGDPREATEFDLNRSDA